MNTDLVPHTKEWFAALKVMNPMQAAQTRQMIKLAGSSNICSICGDTPVHDYRIIGEPGPDARPTLRSIRLCSECCAMRGNMFGERYKPLNAR